VRIRAPSLEGVIAETVAVIRRAYRAMTIVYGEESRLVSPLDRTDLRRRSASCCDATLPT